MIDIVFDFSSSQIGGGLRRIEAYAQYFSACELKTLFLVHPKVAEKIAGYNAIRIETVERTNLSKATGDGSYLRKLGRSVRPRWLFSYGIPIHARIADNHWFHVSNVLPLFLDHVTINLDVRAKMTVLSWWIRRRAEHCDVVSAESLFSIERYDVVTRTSGKRVLLHNGVPEMLLAELHGNLSSTRSNESYAIAVGTLSYKRIDRTYKTFLELKHEFGLKRLKIIGNPAHVPVAIRESDDVDVLSFMNDVEYFDLLSKSRIFISTAETENSSCAVIEGLLLSEQVVLSDIPSHLEMLKPEQVKIREVGSQRMVLSERNSFDIKNIPTWAGSIEKMLVEMRL